MIFFNFFNFNFFYNLKKIVTCQSDVVPRGRDGMMWQWQCHMSP